jgi:hypothetical protein
MLHVDGVTWQLEQVREALDLASQTAASPWSLCVAETLLRVFRAPRNVAALASAPNAHDGRRRLRSCNELRTAPTAFR